ncbi:MAG: hypothetical protein LRY73_08955 [Bacillus sp. (in: Bacteria)]|nr:hypothetical protein [Bacillus sp. (in: firmicutes)]
MIVGFGNLAKSIIHILPQSFSISVYSRTKSKVVEASEVDQRIQWIDPSAFHSEKEVWLMLPREEIPVFLKSNISNFQQGTIFYYCATKGFSKEIKPIVGSLGEVVPVKFIIQADQLMKDKKGMAAIPNSQKHYKKKVEDWLGNGMEIVIGEEEDILFLNKATTEKAINLIMDLQDEMGKKGIPSRLVEHAAKQIVPGVITSYLNNSLGGFGKGIVEERRKRNEGR